MLTVVVLTVVVVLTFVVVLTVVVLTFVVVLVLVVLLAFVVVTVVLLAFVVLTVVLLTLVVLLTVVVLLTLVLLTLVVLAVGGALALGLLPERVRLRLVLVIGASCGREHRAHGRGTRVLVRVALRRGSVGDLALLVSRALGRAVVTREGIVVRRLVAEACEDLRACMLLLRLGWIVGGG